jgi:methionyl-tRNA formyltransferase
VTDLDTLYDRIRMLDAQGYPPAFLDAGPFRFTFSRATRRCESVVADIQITLREETSDD